MNLLISHKDDIDGVTPVILCNLAGFKYEYNLFSSHKLLEEFIIESIDNNYFKEFDNIFIVDLTIRKEICEYIDKSICKDKIYIFDHHLPSDELNYFSFQHSKSNIDNKLESGTSLFYKYLVDNYSNDNLIKQSTKKFVELVRLNDTWDWKKINEYDAIRLSDLYSFYGNDTYIKEFTKRLEENNEFKFIDNELFYLNLNEIKTKRYMEEKEKDIIFCKFHEYNIGVVFAENNRSLLGNYLAEKYIDQIDFIMIININRSISLRGVDKVNLSDIASIYHGGGHFNAAGISLPENIRNDILKLIFKEKIDLTNRC